MYVSLSPYLFFPDFSILKYLSVLGLYCFKYQDIFLPFPSVVIWIFTVSSSVLSQKEVGAIVGERVGGSVSSEPANEYIKFCTVYLPPYKPSTYPAIPAVIAKSSFSV